MFTIYPQAKAANQLITAVCNAISLDLHSGAATGLGNLPLEQQVAYPVGGGEDMTINLAKGADGKQHYAILSVSLSVNNKSDLYKEKETAVLTEQEAIIKDTINNVVRQYTKEEFNENLQDIQKEILKKLQHTFGADYVVGVAFAKSTTD